MPIEDLGAERRARLAAARLYLVCGALRRSRGLGRRRARELPDLLRAAVAGGVQIVQLREKHLDDERARRGRRRRAGAVRAARCAADRQRPPLGGARGGGRRRACRAGRHAGRRGARDWSGPDMLIGLSTHAPAEIDAEDAALADYIGVGPVHETPTKPGRPAVGLELVRYAAEHSPGAVLRDRRARCRQPRRGDRRGRAAGGRPAGDRRRPRTRSARRGRCASCSTRAPLEGSGVDDRPRRSAPAAGALEPLGEDERPLALLIAVAVCALLALGVIIGAATVHDLSRHGGSLPGGVFLAAVLAAARAGHVPPALLGGARLRGAARLPDPRHLARARRRLDDPRGGACAC